MNSPAEWHVEILPSARNALLALRSAIQNPIREAIRGLVHDPFPPESIAMRGKGVGLRRLRVGRYRIVYRVQSQRVRVLVIRIGHRSEVYRGLEGY